MVKTASMAAGALVVSKRWQEENLEWKATVIPYSRGHKNVAANDLAYPACHTPF